MSYSKLHHRATTVPYEADLHFSRWEFDFLYTLSSLVIQTPQITKLLHFCPEHKVSNEVKIRSTPIHIFKASVITY